MVKTAFDIRALQYGFKAHKRRGIGIYTHNLIKRANLAPKELEIVPFHDSCYESEEPKVYNSTPYPHRMASSIRPFVKEYIWQTLMFRRQVNQAMERSGAGTIFFPSHLDVPPGLKVPYAVTAHDMIQFVLNDMGRYSTFKHKFHLDRQAEALRGARLIIAVSAHTKQDIIRYANLDRASIVVVHNGVDPGFRPGITGGLERLELPDRFILNVGGIDYRKNMELLLGAFSSLLKDFPDIYLVMAGDIQSDPGYAKFMGMIQERSLESRVIITGFVSRCELAALYNKADVFFYPSLYEGFGLPVVEAMACGAPVVTTNRSSIPEVTGSSAITLDPDEPESFVEAISALLRSEPERKKLSSVGLRQAAKFSWDKCARETYSALTAI